MQSHFWHGNSKALATLALPKFPGIMISDRYNHPCKCIHFFAMVVCCQILAYAPIYSYFCVVLRSPLINVSPHTHLYPFLPIQSPAHIYSCTACIWNFGGNFPAIRPKSTYCVPIYMNACLVFLSAHTLASCRTHPHPSAPIYVYLHPPKP